MTFFSLDMNSDVIAHRKGSRLIVKLGNSNFQISNVKLPNATIKEKGQSNTQR